MSSSTALDDRGLRVTILASQGEPLADLAAAYGYAHEDAVRIAIRGVWAALTNERRAIGGDSRG